MKKKKNLAVDTLDGLSADIKQDRIQELKRLFPDSVSENKIDTDKLKKSLGDDAAVEDERYRLEWAGKSQVFEEIAKRTHCTLTPVRDRSVNFDSTENIFIEGENLEVLRALQKAYHGKIKMIYIDPPYNTGKDFIYRDNFRQSIEDYNEESCNVDDEGNLKRAFTLNTRESGRYHSNWLSMMYPRLFLARNLLRDDGVIFVSIDDNEVHNLRMVMNEIFGEENFVDSICWKKKYGGGAKEKYLVSVHEYILVYSKNLYELPEILIPFEEERARRFYKNKDNKFELRGYFRTHPLEAVKSVDERENLKYSIKAPDSSLVKPKRQWRWSRERLEQALKNDEVIFNQKENGEWVIYTKQYLNDENGVRRKTKAQSIIDDVFTQEGTKEIENIFGNAKIFSFPKPTKLLQKLLEIANPLSGDIILDFFAGSGAISHSVMLQNAGDGGIRKYISVQLPEETPEKSEARKEGYETISEIAIERIKRAGKKIAKENPKFKGDLGMKVFRQEDSHFPTWRIKSHENDKSLQQSLEAHMGEKVDSSNEDRIFEVLLKLGFDLNADISEEKNYVLAASGEIALVLEKPKGKFKFEDILEKNPTTIVVIDSAFEDDNQKINFALACKEKDVKLLTI